MKRTAVLVAIGLLALAVFGTWWRSTRTARINVVLVTLDTTRADRLGCYGYKSAVTPNLDRFASQAVLFERAFTVVPITLPAHATLHTGLLPPEHGLRINGVSRLSDEVPTLAEILSRHGYRCGAFVSSLVLDARFGLGRAFEKYDDRMGNGPDGPPAERSAKDTISAATSWLESASSGPFFCWIHLYDPHEPYDEHRQDFGEQFASSPYDGEIAFVDRQIGRLFDGLARRRVDERTLVIIVGDHGEGLGDHKEATHGYLAYNSTMHVPLLIKRPGLVRPGLRIPEPVSLVDVFPTILDSLRIPPPGRISGRSLLPATKGEPLELRPCYGETEAPLMEGGWSPLRTWTTPRWKYIHTTRPELFDLEQDPGELRNVVDQYAAKAEELRRALADFEASLTVRRGSAAVLSDAERRALAGLGYAGGQSPTQESDQPRRDIKDTLIHAEHVHRCMHLIDNNQFDEAERLLEGVVAALPDYAKAWGTLGVCRAKQDDYLAAERHFRKALALDANQNFARIGLGRALFAQNRFEDCVEQLEIAVDHEPTALDAQYFLGEASRRLGRWETSRRAFEAAIKRSPDFAPARVGLADLARDEGRLDDAAELYQGLLQRDPAAAALGLASVYRQQERDAETVTVLEDFLRRMPRHVEGLTTLSQLLATSADASVRNPARAVEAAEQACRLTERRQTGPLMSLSKAYAAAGRTERAIQTAETALTLAREAGSATQAEEIEKALSEYRGGR